MLLSILMKQIQEEVIETLKAYQSIVDCSFLLNRSIKQKFEQHWVKFESKEDRSPLLKITFKKWQDTVVSISIFLFAWLLFFAVSNCIFSSLKGRRVEQNKTSPNKTRKKRESNGVFCLFLSVRYRRYLRAFDNERTTLTWSDSGMVMSRHSLWLIDLIKTV